MESKKYISLEKYKKIYNGSDVSYALYIQKNVKANDYVRLITGKICKVFGIGEGKIYYSIYYNRDWCNILAVNNFSNNILDLVKRGDILRYKLKGLDSCYFGIVKKIKDPRTLKSKLKIGNYDLEQIEVLEILTKKQYKQHCYRLEE